MPLYRRIAFNLFTFLPGTRSLPLVKATMARRTFTGTATNSARYCYTVWMRHLVLAAANGLDVENLAVAEIGPGSSLGTGIAALLSGAEEYHALDVVDYRTSERSLQLLDELVQLFASRTPIPDESEFPEVNPRLTDYTFPHNVLGESRLARALDPKRIERIRESLSTVSPTSMILYAAPWTDERVMREGSVDLVFSQAALEHVDDLDTAYGSMRIWLKKGGYLSHEIDFKAHVYSSRWDGHWSYSDTTWKLIRGKDPWAINREPWCTHRRLLAQNGFRVLHELAVRREPTVPRSALAARFRAMPDADRSSSSGYFVAIRE